jgi:hypothetical protein
VLETYRLARDEREFWQRAAQPKQFAGQQGESLEEFLKRVMLYQAPLATPRDLAWFLASYAREAKFRIETGDMPALAGIRAALEEALGLQFEGLRGDRFFRSTLIQTLFYGIFSAWVLWSKSHPPTDYQARFDWRMSAHYLRVPILRKLFHEVAEPGQLETMDLPEVLDWAGAALNRVDRASFFETFEEGHAVQYFYEPFLEAFDPELRKDLGVWYTPVEVVRYMVARVDFELRETLGVADGLADPNVYILDPCCGTGAYLVEVLRKIAETLRGKGGDALAGQDLKRAAMERVFGFEILPAPFVVAHLQLGLLLQSLGAPLADGKKERIGVFLTNALTGWETLRQPGRLPFLELEEERDAADEVKRERPILVILGNPPYNSFAGIANMDEERGLSEAYRTTKTAPAPQGQGLNDLYVRFFRMAERRIVEGAPGKGIVAFISNYSWLDGLSFTGMRERYLEVFDRIWIDCLNGDKYKTGKLTPEGEPDPSVFSTELNKEGIQVGTAISILVRTPAGRRGAQVRFRHLWGKEKRARLLEASARSGRPQYERLAPAVAMGLPFAPVTVAADYLTWPLLPDLFPVSFPGVKTSRDDLVVDIDRDELVKRMKRYFDANISHDEIGRSLPRAVGDSTRFSGRPIRDYLLKRGLKPEYIVRFCYRPFDVRWLYWEPETKLLDEKRADYFPHVLDGVRWIGAAQQTRREYDSPYVSSYLCSLHLIERGANLFPMLLRQGGPLDGRGNGPNISGRASQYLVRLGAAPADLFHHAIAACHAPAYASDNADALRRNWPRVPLPKTSAKLATSARLGQTIAALLDPECPVAGVSVSPLREEIRSIGIVSSVSGSLRPDEGHLDVTAGWGHAGKSGVTMPAQGKAVERDYAPEEIAALGSCAAEFLGRTTFDVYLNPNAYWKNVPKRVWEYTIGGYQVIKKWLSYREKELLGRPLTIEEARYITDVARRIAAILLLAPELDANYEAVKRDSFPWQLDRG